MALLSGVLGGGRADLLCLAAHDASPLSGMVPMYVLMSAFHLAPWLKLIADRRKTTPRPGAAQTAAPGQDRRLLPPSTLRIWPLMYEPSSHASKTIAFASASD